MENKEEKPFDCIQMKREIQARIYDDTKDMTHKEFYRYLREKIAASPFAKHLDPQAPLQK